MNRLTFFNIKAMTSLLITVCLAISCKGREGVEVSDPQRDQRILNLNTSNRNSKQEANLSSSDQMQYESSTGSASDIFYGYLPGESDLQREERIAREKQKSQERDYYGNN